MAKADSLAVCLIRLLAGQPGLRADQLRDRCVAQFRSCSIQAVYQELRKLQHHGVVVKVRDRYSLSLSWASEFIEFADKVYDNYLASASHLEIIPEYDSSRSWRFSNLLRLDDLWVQAMIALFGHTRSKSMFSWIPHPWFYFAQVEKVQQFYRLCEKEGWSYYATIGGETFLDRHYAEQMNPLFYQYRLGEAPVFQSMSMYHTIIGDYLISVKLDQDTANNIEALFESIRSPADATYQSVSTVFNKKAKLSLKIEHNSKKVGAYRRKFQKYFGAVES